MQKNWISMHGYAIELQINKFVLIKKNDFDMTFACCWSPKHQWTAIKKWVCARLHKCSVALSERFFRQFPITPLPSPLRSWRSILQHTKCDTELTNTHAQKCVWCVRECIGFEFHIFVRHRYSEKMRQISSTMNNSVVTTQCYRCVQFFKRVSNKCMISL